MPVSYLQGGVLSRSCLCEVVLLRRAYAGCKQLVSRTHACLCRFQSHAVGFCTKRNRLQWKTMFFGEHNCLDHIVWLWRAYAGFRFMLLAFAQNIRYCSGELCFWRTQLFGSYRVAAACLCRFQIHAVGFCTNHKISQWKAMFLARTAVWIISCGCGVPMQVSESCCWLLHKT